MLYIICYDITSNKVRKIIHDTLLAYGERINLSVFELELSQAKLEKIKNILTKLINPKTDLIKIYQIQTNSLILNIGKNIDNINYI